MHFVVILKELRIMFDSHVSISQNSNQSPYAASTPRPVVGHNWNIFWKHTSVCVCMPTAMTVTEANQKRRTSIEQRLTVSIINLFPYWADGTWIRYPVFIIAHLLALYYKAVQLLLIALDFIQWIRNKYEFNDYKQDHDQEPIGTVASDRDFLALLVLVPPPHIDKF